MFLGWVFSFLKVMAIHLPIQIPRFSFNLKALGRKPAKQETALACDLGKSNVVLLETERSGNDVILRRFLKAERPAEEAALPDFLRQLHQSGNFSSNRVRISVKGQGVIIRFVQFPLMKIEELKSAIVYEAEKYIPFKYNEVALDFHVLSNKVPLANGGAGMDILMVAIRRDELGNLLSIFEKAGLEVELIDIDAVACFNALGFFQPEALKTHVAILDIGTELSTLTVSREGRPRFIRDISYGSADLLKLLKRKLGLSDEEGKKQLQNDETPNPELFEMLQQGLANLVGDLKVSMDYFQDQSQSSDPVQTLYVGGGSGYHQQILIETLTRDLGIPTQTLQVLNSLKLDPAVDAESLKKSQSLLPVALGLCLRNL